MTIFIIFEKNDLKRYFVLSCSMTSKGIFELSFSILFYLSSQEFIYADDVQNNMNN